MRVIIAGSRPPEKIRKDAAKVAAWYEELRPFVDNAVALWTWGEITVVMSGKAAGGDMLGELWAERHGVPVDPYPAIWTDDAGRFHPRAGFERNAKMGDDGEGLIALWDGKSNGTRDMIRAMSTLQKPYAVHFLPDGKA